MRKGFIFCSFLLALFSITSCTKVVDVSLKDAATKVVIQGDVTDQPGQYFVTLNRSVSYTANNVFPAVSGATVSIKDVTAGFTDILTETTPGAYITHTLVGTSGHTYTLSVTVDGVNYSATSTMPANVGLDSITFQTVSAFGFDVTNPLPNFQDPVNIQNNYRFIESINKKVGNDIFVFDDRLSDGKYISRQLFNDSSYIQKGDTVQLDMQCIDRNNYNYFKELSGVDPYNGQPSSPANPTTNIIGGALGYFSAHTSQKKTAIFK